MQILWGGGFLISQNATSSWEKLEKKTDNNSKNIEVVFQYLDELLEKKENPKPRTLIGYKTAKKK